MNRFYLMVEPGILSSFLVSRWLENFSNSPNFLGLLIADDPASEEIFNLRKNIHLKYQGCKELQPSLIDDLKLLYPSISKTECEMIKMFGVPPYSDFGRDFPKINFLSKNINSEYAYGKLPTLFSIYDEKPFTFIFVDQILKLPWLHYSDNRVINGHPAILPFARGVYALEHIIVQGDLNIFLKTTGATVHYIDERIDQGAIILQERILNPFKFESLLQLRSFNFILLFDLLIEVAMELEKRDGCIPVGVKPDPGDNGKVFLRKDGTTELRGEAEACFQRMRRQNSL